MPIHHVITVIRYRRGPGPSIVWVLIPRPRFRGDIYYSLYHIHVDGDFRPTTLRHVYA